MVGNQIKHKLGRIVRKYGGSFIAERDKARLRRKVLASPITHKYLFDPEVKLLRCIGITPSMLDIGANTGIYSVALEDIVGSDHLYVFEPLPHLHRDLKQRFKKAHVFDFALSNREGRQRMRVPYVDGQLLDSRATFNRHAEPNQTGYDEIEVRLFPLDKVVKELDIPSVGFIKIDVEGHEIEVLDGGIETLTRWRPLILIEIEARHHQVPITDIFARFEAMGYKGYYVDPTAYELCEIVQFDQDRDQQEEHLRSRDFMRYLNNFFFVHKASESDFVLKARAFLDAEKQCVKQGASS